MPNRTIALTDEEDAVLVRIAAANNTTVDDLLLAEARTQIGQARDQDLAEFWRDLPLADRLRIRAAETA